MTATTEIDWNQIVDFQDGAATNMLAGQMTLIEAARACRDLGPNSRGSITSHQPILLPDHAYAVTDFADDSKELAALIALIP